MGRLGRPGGAARSGHGVGEPNRRRGRVAASPSRAARRRLRTERKPGGGLGEARTVGGGARCRPRPGEEGVRDPVVPDGAPTVSEAVEFMSVHGPYGQFSNFAGFPVEIDGRTWPTAEHYFQAQKFAGAADEEEIRL